MAVSSIRPAFAANEIPSVSGKGGLNSAYPSDFYICRPLTLPFQILEA